MNKYSLWLVLVVSFILTAPTLAQDAPICPAKILLSLARSSSACFGLARNEACFGNGTVMAQAQASTIDMTFAQAGDIASLLNVSEIQAQPVTDDVSVANLLVQGSLTDNEERSVAFLLLGDATLHNDVPFAPEYVVRATGSLNIRRTPESDGEVVEKMAINKTVIANGRTEDGKWLRVDIPNSNDMGWVGRDVVSSEDDINTLVVVDTSTPYFRPFQVFTLKSADASLCDGALAGGLLLQTPNIAQYVDFTINGVNVRLAATAYLQMVNGNQLVINILDGAAELAAGGKTVFIPAGSRTTITVDGESGQIADLPAPAAPYAMDDVNALPVNNLPNRVKIAEALTSEEIATILAEREAAANAVILVEATPDPDSTCQRMVRRDTTLWAGPGEYYEAINAIAAGDFINPVLQIDDADGNRWWQLRNSNWIRTDVVKESGDCASIPVIDFLPPQQTNTLSLETCETNNGPLRIGQSVTIQFIPPAWNNYGEARDAVAVDRGRISVDGRPLYVYASEPIELGTSDGPFEDRYLRIFSSTWIATGGSHRIVGDRLHYLPTCNITVPFG
jgi:hypothetical protein